MKKRYWAIPVGMLLGGAAALIQSLNEGNILTFLIKPFTALGLLLRGWSLSGAKGNAAAWAVLIVLSLLPIIYILIARRKRKQSSDWLFLLTGAGVFAGLFLLINPTLYVHPAMSEALSISPELLTAGPTFMMLSMLLLSAAARWSGGLMGMKKPESRLIFWTQALMVGSMALISFSVGGLLAEGVLAVWGGGAAATEGWMVYDEAGGLLSPSDPSIQSLFASSADLADSTALITLLLTALSLIPDLFSIRLLDSAVSLVGGMGRGMFSDETDECASILAVRARYTMLAAVACMTLENTLTVLLAQWIQNWDMSFFLPLDELLLSCGAMLLARLLSAACRVKRDNDLMI